MSEDSKQSNGLTRRNMFPKDQDRASSEAHASNFQPTQASTSAFPSTPNYTYWLSPNPDKAWTEKFYLAYTPFWMASISYMMFSGAVQRWSDMAMMGHAIFTIAPIIVIPALYAPRLTTDFKTIKDQPEHESTGGANKQYPHTQELNETKGNKKQSVEEIPWHQRHHVKATLYLTLYSLFGNYIGSEYFFDVLGMVYHFPNITTNFDSALVGSGSQRVPVIMYFYTVFYFGTYHVLSTIMLRRLSRLLDLDILGKKTKKETNPAPSTIAHTWWKWLIWFLAIILLSYAVAFAETKSMTHPTLAVNFYYLKPQKVQVFGSLIYAIYFSLSFPVWYRIDESVDNIWGVWEVTAGALSVSMACFYGLDFVTWGVGEL